MLETLTFDTEPLVSFFLGEAGAKPVIDLLQKIQSGELEGYINIVNLTEAHYTIARRDPKAADEKLKMLRIFGLKVVPVEENGLWREADHHKKQAHAVAGRLLRSCRGPSA